MAEYISPGVYIVEVDSGPQPIEGVSTSTTGFVGMTVRGPVTGPPVLVTSFAEFTRIFGGFLPDSTTFHESRYLPYAVKGFFDNEGARAYIVRVQGGSNGTAADGGVLVGGLITRLTADAGAGATSIQLASTRGLTTASHVSFRQVKNGVLTQEGPIAVNAYKDNGQVTLGAGLTNSYQAQYTSVTTDETDPGTHCELQAADPGAWGNNISVQIVPSSRAQAQVQSVPNTTTVVLTSAASFYPGALVEFNKGNTKVARKVQSVAGNNLILTNALATVNDLDPDGGFTVTSARSCEFDVLASWSGGSEQWRFLGVDNTLPNYYATVINAGSTLLSVPSAATGDTRDDPAILPSAPDGLNLPLINGTDGTTAPADSDYIGTDGGPGNRTGIQSLIDADDIAIVAVPGVTSQHVQNALITHCETLRYRFAILDPAPHSGGTTPTMDDIQAQRNLYDTKYAAIYYPRISVLDPLTNLDITVPPSGHIAGIYARVDDTRGVFKAPANEVIGGIDAIEVKLSKGDQDVLNPDPININALRDFTAQSRGLRVYGARCITSDSEWKYINVRRLFIFIEHSLDIGTQWAVFEPNDERLWARLSQSVSAFLNTLWSEGALMGSKASDAFFVRCDRTTMTQDDLDNGRLIMLVGIAPVYPAEFVIIRIGQWVGGSSVQEL